MSVISFWCDFSILVATFLFLIIVWCNKRFNYWKSKGVIVPVKPVFFFGNLKDVLFGKLSLGEFFAHIYYVSKETPFVGIYTFFNPTFFINDMELIKTVLVKDFIHFPDHNFPVIEKNEPLSAHLFNLTGETWKNLRVKLTPTFTTSKMKYMFETVAQCGKEMMTYLDEHPEEETSDIKDVLAKLNTDIIGSCAFGLECNSFKNPDSEFRKQGKRVLELSGFKAIVQSVIMFYPKLGDMTGLRILDKETNDFFYNIVNNTIKFREENNIERKDFLQLLIQLKRDGVIEDDAAAKPVVDDGTRLTTMQLAAQVFVFFIAGFETSSTTASFALYELALNPDIQETLQQEIDEVLAKTNGEITYDSLGEMTYLTMCIEETLRKYPPLPMIFRICTKNYVIPGTEILIEKDTPVMIPILGIQRDPQYYPDPMKFDPERFTPENKASRHHFSYLPFGEGPRICIGSRFGMMQTRLGLASLLSKYTVSPCDKTNIPMKYDNKTFILTSDGGVWLKLTKRNK